MKLKKTHFNRCFEFQFYRMASKWVADTKRDPATAHAEIKKILQDQVFASFGGLAGEKTINVPQVNLELRKRYGAPS